MGKTQKRMSKTQKRMSKTQKRMGKTQKRMGKTQKRMGKTQKRMSKRGGDSPELSDEEKQVLKYLRNPMNLFKNRAPRYNTAHAMFPVERVRTMDAQAIMEIDPERVGYYYFNDTKLTDAQRQALAKVLVKKIKLDLDGTHRKREGFLDKVRTIDPVKSLLTDTPMYDAKHLTDSQLKQLPRNFVRYELDPKYLGYYQDTSQWDGNYDGDLNAAIDRKEDADLWKQQLRKEEEDQKWRGPGLPELRELLRKENNP
jgi:hypothetical protein